MKNTNTHNVVNANSRLHNWALKLGLSQSKAGLAVAAIAKLNLTEAHAKSVLSAISSLDLSELRFNALLKEISPAT